MGVGGDGVDDLGINTGAGGGGGGGFGTAGGTGGKGDTTAIGIGGAAGSQSGNDELVPLRGGCPGAKAARAGR